MVPASDPHCLTQPPPEVPDKVRAFALAGRRPTDDELDALEGAYADSVVYGKRAFNLCGSKKP